MNWLDNLVVKLFKWKFYKKFNIPQQYYINVLANLNKDYCKMYLERK